MQATVTPVPDAEPPPGHEQNTGVSGATHAVAYDPVAEQSRQGGQSRQAGQPRPRRRRPIRYGHGGTTQPEAEPPTVETGTVETGTVETGTVETGTVETGTVLSGVVVPPPVPTFSPNPTSARTRVEPEPDEADEYDEIAGLIYEAPQAGEERTVPLPADEDEAADEPDAGSGRLRNDGLGIFGGVATTEVTDDEPAAAPPTRVMPVGTAWNQQVAATPPLDGEGADGGKQRPFGAVRGLLRGGGGSDPDDAGPSVGVRDLPVDVQVHFIRVRFIISIVVGVVIGAITRSWEIGLTLAILAWILDTVRRSRSAAIYQNGASFPGARKQTSKQLRKMRREGYFTLDARPIPDSREFIDHLVVGPTGVYAIDSEKWDPRLPIRTWNGKKLYHGPQSQKDRLEHAVWEANAASEILSGALGTEITVQPALAIYGPKIPWDITTIRNVDVFTGSSLIKYLKRRGRMKEGVTRLTGEEVRTIYQAAARMLPDVTTTHTDTTFTSVG